MTSIALTLPDEPADMPGWLERQLVSADLGVLVAELKTIHGGTSGGPTLDTILGDSAARVLQDGLGALPRNRFSDLLRHPKLLMELQERVLLDGGHYWRQLSNQSAASRVAANGLNKVQAAWSIPTPAAQTRMWWTHPAIASLATAAAILLAVYTLGDPFGRRSADQPIAKSDGIGWGWAKAGAIPTTGTAKDYLKRLAVGADEWSKKKPDSAVAMGRRINEFRVGCTALIFAAHQPLNEADRKWLVERCRVWGERLDKQLQALEAGTALANVQTGVDEIAANITQSLRTRADSTT